MKEQLLSHAETPMQNMPIEKLMQLGIKPDEYNNAFDVEGEIDFDGLTKNEVKMNELAEIMWLRFNKPDDQELSDTEDVEGKLYLPKENANGELILFTPGFPGGNAGRFEKQYASTFIKEGYAFFTLRHNGTSLDDSETAKDIINCPKRLEVAKSEGQRHVGGTREGGNKPSIIINETITPLAHLYKAFTKIHLMGQSMGTISNNNTINRLKDRPEIINKIGNVVAIAGYFGKKDGEPEEVWEGMKMTTDDIVEYEKGYIEQVKANAIINVEEMQKLATVNSQVVMPAHIGNVLIFTPGDPLLSGPDKEGVGEAYLDEYGPKTDRKLVIRDETNLDKPKQHSMLWIEPKNLIRAVKANVSSHGPHYIKAPKSPERGMLEKA